MAELLLAGIMFAAARRVERRRELSGSADPVTMGSSPWWLALWFFYHLR
jgi:hypothetical protein